jgi:Glutamate-cysteine ligase
MNGNRSSSQLSFDMNGTSSNSSSNGVHFSQQKQQDGHLEYGQFTIDEIMNGHSDQPGLVDLVEMYLDHQTEESLCKASIIKLKKMCHTIRNKANGRCKTGARWIRDYIQQHPAYGRDSVVTDELQYDLCVSLVGLQMDDLMRK